ncbi:5'-AMP-activated protein kinase catalytic subunit alpha-2 [Trichinella spiralis]|uniref:5'-AMP-activated protein kinase catalytic subunit alpha-2 n=1 Tax=Trichinella spiralis TaxID=6334 RepID=UPI0001EFD659|nr:5'-AMP-activated protein kinase catalytic subunit alpha-2 [Trichinella spiralis]
MSIQWKEQPAKTIMAHPWFARNVPNYLFPKISDEETSIVDLSVVKQISRKFHATEKKVITVLKQNDPYNRLSIAYNLAVEKRRREQSTSNFFKLAEDFFHHKEKKFILLKLLFI